MMNIKALLYDLGDIFFEAHYWRKWNYEELKKARLFQKDFSEFYFLYESFLLKSYENICGYDECFTAFLLSLNVPDINGFKTKSYLVKEKYEHDRILFAGVKETLKTINDMGLLNVVVTDNEQSGKKITKTILRRFEIEKLISNVFSSKDEGITKNESAFFISVLKKIKLNNSEVVFIAHDADEISSARNAGITTIEFNNYLKIKNEADYRIKNFNQIPELIKGL